MSERQESPNPFVDSAIAGGYDTWFGTPLGRAVERAQRRAILRAADPIRGQSALDVGTGTGHYAHLLTDMGLTVVGCDPSAAMLAVARAKRSSVSWVQSEAESLPSSAGQFDLVLSVTAIEFMRDRDLALREMFRVVAPGGRLIVATLNAQSAFGRMYIEGAARGDTVFRSAHLLTATELCQSLSLLGQANLCSASFLAPSGRGLVWAPVIETLGRICRSMHGALLIGRVDK